MNREIAQLKTNHGLTSFSLHIKFGVLKIVRCSSRHCACLLIRLAGAG